MKLDRNYLTIKLSKANIFYWNDFCLWCRIFRDFRIIHYFCSFAIFSSFRIHTKTSNNLNYSFYSHCINSRYQNISNNSQNDLPHSQISNASLWERSECILKSIIKLIKFSRSISQNFKSDYQIKYSSIIPIF